MGTCGRRRMEELEEPRSRSRAGSIEQLECFIPSIPIYVHVSCQKLVVVIYFRECLLLQQCIMIYSHLKIEFCAKTGAEPRNLESNSTWCKRPSQEEIMVMSRGLILSSSGTLLHSESLQPLQAVNICLLHNLQQKHASTGRQISSALL